MTLPVSEIGELTVMALAPYVRALLAGIGDGAVKGAGKDVYETAKALYQQLFQKLGVDPTTKVALSQLAAAPGQTAVQQAVKETLISLLQADPALAQSLSSTLENVDDSTRERISIGGNVSGEVVQIGSGNVVNNNTTVLPAPPIVGALNPFGVPYQRNSYFAGREAVLLQLHEQLTRSGAAAMTQVQAISGLGGIGKTQTAVEYAYRYYYEQPVYDTVFWVKADTEVNLASDFAAIAMQVAIPGAETLQPERQIAAVRTWLNTHPNWLLIFDNADQPDWLTEWMPTNPHGKVLVTSRASVFDQLGIQRPIALDVLSEAEALTLLFEHTGIARTASAEAEAIALNQALDGLPLALEQARAYIARQKIGFGSYLRTYQNQGLTHLEKARARTGRYPSSVLKTWQLNITAVTQANPAATALLELSAFLAPDEIPERIVVAGASHLGAPLGEYLQSQIQGQETDDESVLIALRELIALLSQYSLVRWQGEPSIYSVHRLVQAVVRDQIAAERAADWLAEAINAVAYSYPGEKFEHWPLCRQLLPHWQRLVEQAHEIAYQSEILGALCNQAGFFLESQGRYGDAEPLYVEALEIRKSELGDRHPDTAGSLFNLAALYHQTERHQQALPLIQDAIAIYMSVFGADHPTTQAAQSWLQAIKQALSE